MSAKRVAMELGPLGQIAATQTESMMHAQQEKFVPLHALFELTPSATNPRRPSLDKAQVTVETARSLRIAEGEDQAAWEKRLEAHLEMVKKTMDKESYIIWEEIVATALSIKVNGLLQPVVANKERTIIAGERRWISSIIAGRENIKVLLRDVNNTDEVVLRFIENTLRSDLSFAELLLGLRSTVEAILKHPCGPDMPGLDYKVIQKLIGKGVTQCSLYKTFCQLPENDAVLVAVLNGDYDSQQDAYIAAKERVEQLRAGSADTSAETEDQGQSAAPAPAAPKEKRATMASRIPGTEGGKLFLQAVMGLPNLPDEVKQQITGISEQWAAAPDKARKKMLTNLLNSVFDSLDQLDDHAEAGE